MIHDRIVSRLGAPAPSGGGLSRRRFIQAGAAAGGGLMLSLTLPLAGGEAEAADAAPFAPNAFIRIGGDGRITLVMPYVEMGQGTYTSIPMLIAEELEVGLDQVSLEHAPPDPKRYGNPVFGGIQATGGSTSIRAAWKPLREAGAVARTMLVAAAAKRWSVDPAACHAQHGEVLHPPTGKRASYGELARRRGPDARAGKGRAQAAARFHPHRHAGQAAGHAGEGQRNGDVRHRRPPAGGEDRNARPVAGLWRPAEEPRRQGGARGQGRAPGRQARRRGRGRRRPYGRRQKRARRAQDRMGRGALRQAQDGRHRG